MHSNIDKKLTDPGMVAEALFRNAPDAILVTDINDVICLVNPAFEILFGYSIQEITGKTSRSLYVDEDQFDLIHSLDQHSSDNNFPAFYVYEINFRTKNGKTLNAQAVIGHVTDNAGQVIGCITFIHDISKQKRDDTILKQREREMSSIIENIPLMLYLKDIKDLRYVYINQEGEKLIGQSGDWLVGKTVNDILPPEQAAATTASDREVIASGDTTEIDEELVRTPQGDRVFRTRKAVIWCGEGMPLYLLGLSEDITERKQAREELQHRREQLEDIANSVPGALYQFCIQNDGSISFPYVSEGLRKILGLPEDADIADPDTLKACIHPDDMIVIEETSRAALAGPGPWEAEFRVCTVSGIRWLHGHAHPRQQTDGSLLFNGVVTDVSARHRMEERLLTEREQTLAAHRSKQQELIQLCKQQKTAINNLINRLQVSKSQGTDDEVDHCIQELSRSSNSLLEAVDSMPPPLDASGFPGKNIFTDTSLEPQEYVNKCYSTANILYIEDNPSNLALLEQAFARVNEFVLHTATTPLDGLNQARRLQPDIILVDINLPGMDGYELLSELRKDPALAAKPVIAVTAQAMPWDIEKGRQAGFRAYVTKPIDIPELLRTLRENLQD